MARRFRFALAGAALVAAVMPGSALAKYVPKLIVSHTPPNVSSAATTISIELTREDDATAKVTFYAPLGYQGVLGQAAGTQIGTVAATVQALAISADAILPLQGVIRTDDPAKYVANPCAPGTHSAVWLLALEAAGRTLAVPIYLDTVTAGPEATFAAFKLQVCLPPPDIPEAQGGAAFGAKLLTATLELNQALTAPTTRAQYVWPGIFTPYIEKAGRPNVAGTVEARAVVRLPGQLTLNGKITSKKNRTVRLSGAVTENGVGIAGAAVELLLGTRRFSPPLSMRSGSGGRYAFNLRRRGRGKIASTFRTRARVDVRDVTAAGCATPTVPPVPCVSATAGAFTILSRAVRITL
jgi:hypothetical protein